MASSSGQKKKKIAKSTSEMSKEMLIQTLKKKKECNAKALAVVERLCDSCSFNEEWLLSNLEFINQSHFDDVIVERAIQKLCGYPLCKAKLENVPSKKYHISTRLNKVYDISERKNFCSGICYKAGMYLKSQLLTSPLWVRDQEIIPKFKLLPCNSTESMGEEVLFLPEKEQIKQEVLSEKKKIDNSHVEKTCLAFDNMKLNNGTTPAGNQDRLESEKIAKVEVEQEEKCINSVKEECETEKLKGLVKDKTLSTVPESKNCEKAVKEQNIKNKLMAADPVKKVEKCINEWFSFDTVLYLFGKEKVKDLIKDRKEEIKDIIGKKPLSVGYNERIDRMIQFYSLLEHQVFNSESVNKNLRPLPDYSAIKEDGKKLQVKVKAFYSGQLEVKEYDVEEKTQDVDSNKESEIYLPTVDAHAQTTLRIKIVLDHFNKIIPELIRTFTRTSCFETSELRNLVNHFTLSAHNIIFKPGEWYLMGFIVIKLLSVKNKQLECLLNTETGRKNVTLFLMNYNLPEDYLERIVEWLLNEESLVRKLKLGEDKK